ncbi:hypothetical protein M1M30_gp051 [Maribacter phage Colly_1]|uniref:Uncharacterized protein n=1 Tax=Maribacter phage Colly_1 TaxID=2745691 RepID=A0A8E4XZS1_9CAUD|nr:hypothetical protein M1M30_gp051 [Maribacter phage Colly_1]QQO97335.1 hypothetical protein Colly1_51 [Maribacter phage Colly_1]
MRNLFLNVKKSGQVEIDRFAEAVVNLGFELRCPQDPYQYDYLKIEKGIVTGMMIGNIVIEVLLPTDFFKIIDHLNGNN